jgi:hypothetical protein
VEASLDDELRGAQVSSVVFIKDYVQLHLQAETDEHTPFGNRVRDIHLNAITDPIVEVAGQRFAHGDDGWRDAMCQLIDRHVTGAVVDASEVRLDFDGDIFLRVSLREEDRVGPEAVVIGGLRTWGLLGFHVGGIRDRRLQPDRTGC